MAGIIADVAAQYTFRLHTQPEHQAYRSIAVRCFRKHAVCMPDREGIG